MTAACPSPIAPGKTGFPVCELVWSRSRSGHLLWWHRPCGYHLGNIASGASAQRWLLALTGGPMRWPNRLEVDLALCLPVLFPSPAPNSGYAGLPLREAMPSLPGLSRQGGHGEGQQEAH